MPYKVVTMFRLEPGQADAEIARCRSEHSLLNLLRDEPGFISFEVIKLGEDGTMVVQTWRTKEHLTWAMPKAAAARTCLTGTQENLVVSSEMFAGEVALASGWPGRTARSGGPHVKGYNTHMDASRSWFRIGVDEYLEGERDAPVKHEYVYGEVFALAGTTDVHNVIAGNIHTVLNLASRRKGCRAYISDMKVRIDERFYYPDVMFVCDDGPDPHYKDKPCVIIEVLSPSTVRTDTNEKRYSYLELPSLQLYLLIDSRRRFVWGYYRGQTGWDERFFGEGETIPVPCADVELSAEDIYIQTPYI